LLLCRIIILEHLLLNRNISIYSYSLSTCYCFMLTILGDVCSYSIITPFLLLDIICLDVLNSLIHFYSPNYIQCEENISLNIPNDASYQSSLVLAGFDKQGYCRHVVNHHQLKKMGENIMCRHMPKVPYGSYAPDGTILRKRNETLVNTNRILTKDMK
jgi:hypothetical protein